MIRLFSALICGVLGAAILHLIIILTLPYFSTSDAYARVVAEDVTNRFLPLATAPDAAGLFASDPSLRVAVCAFDVTAGPQHLTAKGGRPFWSLSVFDRTSGEVFSMSNRTAVAGALNVILGTAAELAAIRRNAPETGDRAILVEMAQPKAYAVLRTLVPQPSYGPGADAFLAEAACAPEPPAT